MRSIPPLPTVSEAPSELFERGHLWIREYVDGCALRFRMDESGLIRFGDATRPFDGEIPLRYRRAVRRVRERLDREGLRSAVDDVESVTFFGVATVRRGIDYDWDRMPAFLGTDVWSESRGRFLPPDGVDRGFDRLGLSPVNTFEKEARAADVDPTAYEIPASKWYDGPAAGVVFRNKTGLQAVRLDRRLLDEGARESSTSDVVDPAELAAQFAARGGFRRVVDELESSGRPVTLDAVLECALERIARRTPVAAFDADSSKAVSELRSAVASETSAFLGSS